MKILVINAGSSSLKYQFLEMPEGKLIAKGNFEKIGLPGSFYTHKAKGREWEKALPLPTHNEAISALIELLTTGETGVVSSLAEISGIGHRVVHGGEFFSQSVVIDDSVIEKITEHAPLAPLHNPANLLGILACKKVMGKTPQVATFDTSFHATMPEQAFLYGLPYEAYSEHKIRRYGFHGTSHRYVSNEAIRLLGSPEESKVVVCHIGNGSSVTAVKNGKSVDTSMGFTPLAGVIMGTRCGDIDTSILPYLSDKTGMDLKQMMDYCNKKSGFLGISGVTSDCREVNQLAGSGNARAAKVMPLLAYQLKKYIGSYAAAMGGLDAVAFTGGIGENDAGLRALVLSELQFLGIRLDETKNGSLPRGTNEEITLAGSSVKAYRIPTNEEYVIAFDTLHLIQ